MSVYKGFFNQSIREFFYGDIESCMEVAKRKQHGDVNFSNIGGLNFTAGLVIFCIIEMSAGFYKGKDYPSADDVSEFLKKYFSKHTSLFKDINFCKKFHEVFRHGFVHEWSPKACSVDMNFNDDYLLKTIVGGGGREILQINIPTLFLLTKKAFADYERDLDAGLYIKEFDIRYSSTIKNDYQEMEELKRLVKIQYK